MDYRELDVDIIRILGIGLVTVFASMLLKSIKPEISLIVGLCGGVLILFQTIYYIFQIVETFTNIIQRTGINTGLFRTVLKIIGVGYLAEFGANACIDAGSVSVADKIVFAGKIIILVMSLPIVTNIIQIIMEILP